MPIKKTEDGEQQAVMEWAALMVNRWPALCMLYHVPNEAKRSKATAARMARMGLRAGVPDLCLDAPAGKYHGLRIELKVEPNRPTEEQRRWLRNLRVSGYFAAACYSAAAVPRVHESALPVETGAGQEVHPAELLCGGDQKMKRVIYSMYGAAVCCGITENVWKQMEKLGYKVISGTIYTGNDECDSISFASIDLGLKMKQPAKPAAKSGPPQNRGRAQ